MVDLIRITKGAGIDFIKPKLVPLDGFGDPEVFAARLKQQLSQAPEDLFILVALDKAEEEPKPLALLIAVAPDKVSHVFVVYAWSEGKNNPRLIDSAFSRLCVWAEAKGRDSIRMETKREPNAFTRRHGFTVFSTIMSFDLSNESSLPQTLGTKTSGDTNGRKQFTIDDEHVERTTEADQESVGAVDLSGDQSGSTSVHGSIDRGIDSSLAERGGLPADVRSDDGSAD